MIINVRKLPLLSRNTIESCGIDLVRKWLVTRSKSNVHHSSARSARSGADAENATSEKRSSQRRSNSEQTITKHQIDAVGCFARSHSWRSDRAAYRLSHLGYGDDCMIEYVKEHLGEPDEWTVSLGIAGVDSVTVVSETDSTAGVRVAQVVNSLFEKDPVRPYVVVRAGSRFFAYSPSNDQARPSQLQRVVDKA